MKAIFNDQLVEFNQLNLSPSDRGFRYGDGLFETIALINGAPRFLDRHYKRVISGADTLRFHLDLSLEKLQEWCDRLIKANNIEDYGKLRWFIWRQGDGLYQPENNKVNTLLTIDPVLLKRLNTTNTAGFSTKVSNYSTSYSSFKTISSLKYVIAGIEKEEQGWDDIIINDHNGFVSEALYSNIFIKKDNTYFTPPISTGCIGGIMRSWLMDEMKRLQYPVEEKLLIPNELLEAEHVFTANSIGVRHILSVGRSNFEIDMDVEKMIDKIS